MSDKIRVAACRFGKGVFAGSMIHKGEEILRFAGPLISLEEALAKGARQCDPLQIGPSLYVDIEPPGVLVNHSCSPNAGIRDDLRLIAIADINVGEEIFYDYSTTMNEDHWTLACLCGSASCRGSVGDFKYLPFHTRRRYLRFGIVQSYLQRQFAQSLLPWERGNLQKGKLRCGRAAPLGGGRALNGLKRETAVAS